MKPLAKMLVIAFIHAMICTEVKAQTPVANQLAIQVPITSSGVTQGALLSLPDDYATTTTTYPLLVFLHGRGEAGTNLANIYNHSGAGGPAYFIARNQFPTSFTNPADGKAYKFIICSPQAPSYSTSGPQLNFILQDLVKKYRVDINRIYLTGISAGGDGMVGYVTRANVTPVHLPAAIVPMSAAIGNPTQTQGNTIANDNIRAWGLGSYVEDIFGENTSKLMDVVNKAKAGLARYTDYKGGHCCWNTYYNPTYKASINGVSMNIYEWMLQFTRGNIGTPTNRPPVATAGSAQTITLPTNSVTLSGSATDPDGTIASTAWTKTSGPAAFTITNPSSGNTTVTGLVAGTYVFTITATDNAGAVNSATVQITVNAAPAVNQPPIANAGPDQTIYLPQDSVLLSGSGSDADGSIVKYEWTTVSGGSSNPSAPSAPKAQPGGKSYVLKADAQGYLVINNGSIYKPGDTLYLDGYFKQVAIYNMSGAAGNYITVTNAPGKTAIIGDSLWSGGAYAQGLVFRGCHYLEVYGSTKANFKIVGSNSTATDGNGNPVRTAYADLAFSELSDNVSAHDLTIRHGGSGIFAKTEINSKDSRTWYPNTYLNNWEFYNLDIYNTYNEAMYIGHTASYWNINNNSPLYPGPNDPAPDPSIYKRPIKLTNVKIYNNYIHDIGNDAIQTAAIDGLEIYNNEVKNWATKHESSHNGGLLIGGRVKGFNVHDNYVHDGWGELIQVYAEGGATSTISNNLLVRNQGEGISFRGTNNLIVNVTNNTIAYVGANSARVNGYFGQTGNQLFNKNMFINAKSAYIYTENGAKVTEGTAPNDNKKLSSLLNLLVDELNFFQPLLTSPLLGYGYKKGNNTSSNHTIVNPGSPVTWVKGLTEGSYVFRLTVTDNNGATHFEEVTVVVRPPVNNKAPKANAGNDKTITQPTNTATLDGSGTDEDGTVTGYAWKKLTGPSQFTIASATSASTAVNNLDAGVYEFELTVTDNIGATAKDTVKVTVNAGNKTPVVTAGTDISITMPTNAVSLNGTATDADGTIASTVWTKIAGPSQFTIANANNLSTDVTNLLAGDYQFVLTATDDKGAVGKDTIRVSVKVLANQAPVVAAGTDLTITLPASSVTLNGTATDADGTISNTRWTKISGPAQFTINNAFNLSTDITNLVGGVYEFELQATDDKSAVTKDTIKITVIVPANKPPVVNAGSTINIQLPTSSATLNGTATDADGTISTTVWSKLAGPSSFSITTPNALSTDVTTLVAGAYDFVLTATDDKGAVGKDTVRVVVKDAAVPNVTPIADAGTDISITLPTNSVTLTGYMSDDPDGTIQQFSWAYVSGPATYNIANSSAMITSAQNLVEGVYKFRLTVTDIDGATGTDEVTVTVRATPNIPPAADAGADVTITLPVNTVSLDGSNSKDNDGAISNYSWTYVSGPSTYTIVNGTSAAATVNNLVEGVYVFMLTVTDDKGAKATNDVVVTVNRRINQAPAANAGTAQTITLPANSVTLNGSGTDNDGSITKYAWTYVSGPSTYNIVSNSTASTVVNGLVSGVYRFRLTVTDNDGATASSTVQITVNNAANVPPTANAGGNRTITLPNNTVSLNGTGADTDGTITRYAWSWVSGPATYNIVSRNSASTAVNLLVQGVYVFRLTVTDDDGATATSQVTVTVNAAPNQAPTVNAGNNQTITLPNNSVNLSGSGSDADGTITSYKWSYVSGPTQYNIVSPNNAATVLNNLISGDYVFRLTVTDNDGATAGATVTIKVNEKPNEAPIANAGPDQEVDPTPVIVLDGTASFDPDGYIDSYNWTKISGPNPFNMTDFVTPRPNLLGALPGTYKFRLTITDNRGAEATDEVTIIVHGENKAPVADAGSDTAISFPTDIHRLNGSRSRDEDGQILSYRWEWKAGPTKPNFNQNDASPIVSNMKIGTHVFELTVTDDKGATATDVVSVEVKNDHVARDALMLKATLVESTVTWMIFTERKENVNIVIVDISGRVVKKTTAQINPGSNSGNIDVSDLTSRSVYIFHVMYADGTHKSIRFLKK